MPRHYFDYPDAYAHWHFIASWRLLHIRRRHDLLHLGPTSTATSSASRPAGNKPLGDRSATTLRMEPCRRRRRSTNTRCCPANHGAAITEMQRAAGHLRVLPPDVEGDGRKTRQHARPAARDDAPLRWALPVDDACPSSAESRGEPRRRAPISAARGPASRSPRRAIIFALLKAARVMSLVVFTALTGLMLAPSHPHPVICFISILAIAVGAGAAGLPQHVVGRPISIS